MLETASPIEDKETSPPPPSIELHGPFDAKAARSALETLRRNASTNPVLVDFSKVNFFQDFALGLFVQELSRLPEVHLQTRGLPAHPARILQYLRIDPHTLAPIRMNCPASHPERGTLDLDD